MSKPILHDCSQACAGFRSLPNDPWTDYGLCRLPGARWAGFPVPLGQACAEFQPRTGPVDTTARESKPELENVGAVLH